MEWDWQEVKPISGSNHYLVNHEADSPVCCTVFVLQLCPSLASFRPSCSCKRYTSYANTECNKIGKIKAEGGDTEVDGKSVCGRGNSNNDMMGSYVGQKTLLESNNH